jgi:hypothetical protein
MTKSVIRVAILLCICVAQLCKATGPSISVEIDPSLDQNAMAVWLAYLLAREQYHIEHALPVPTSGEIVPPFEEEVAARNTTVQIYKELKEKDKQLHDDYWETLTQIKAKGFMEAYVWTYLHRPEWPKNDEPKNMAAFEAWKNANLRNHQPKTVGRLTAQTE